MNAQVIAIDDLNKNALGRIVFWSLSGDVELGVLKEALGDVGCQATPPDEPTKKVALTRAIDRVAKAQGCEKFLRKQGDWAIVEKSIVQEEQKYLKQLVRSEAKINVGTLEVTGDFVTEITDAFNGARCVLAPSDIGHWLCAKLRELGAVALRDSGGFYFVPQTHVAKWTLVAQAIGKASGHTIHAIPAMRSRDAIDAILQAITSDTRSECEKINTEVSAGLGKLGAAHREEELADLADRLERYEGLLDMRLDELRTVLDTTQASLAAARLGQLG